MTTTTDHDLRDALIAHWRHRADLEVISRDLARRRRDREALTLEDLAAHDQLHAGGLEATRRFSAWVDVPAGARVLDLGAGLGGAARLLAREHGCEVTALELSPDLTATGATLTAWLGLEARVAHVAGTLEALPEGARFDLLWMQHLDIHLPDKRAFYAQCRGFAAPGSRLVWHDWLAGPGGPPRWPLPWSADGALSFLTSEPALRATLSEAGFALRRFEELTALTHGWYAKLEQALTKALARDVDGNEAGRRRRAALLHETRTLLQNLVEARLRPFFGEADPI